jgi:squalene cyclase
MYNLGGYGSLAFQKAFPTISAERHSVRWTSITGQRVNEYLDRKTIDRAIQYIHAAQTPEGLWFGSWGICFTYASMFALESLSLAGETYTTSPRVKKACDCLVSKQMFDGGWGESYRVRDLICQFTFPF